MSEYEERPRKGGGTECKFQAPYGENQWRRLLPIAFTAENAQKVHAGTKTQTRRLLNPQPFGNGQMQRHSHADLWMWKKRGSGFTKEEFKPRYRVGDMLWVQEPWRASGVFNDTKPTQLPLGAEINYEGADEDGVFGKLRPGRFLPLRFARPARYEVTAVRLERVNEISEADARAEGARKSHCEFRDSIPPSIDNVFQRNFAALWDSIHAEPGTRFEDVPWVFAYTFRRVR